MVVEDGFECLGAVIGEKLSKFQELVFLWMTALDCFLLFVRKLLKIGWDLHVTS